jgi:hypothetical protein
VDSAVGQVARELKISKSKVWEHWGKRHGAYDWDFRKLVVEVAYGRWCREKPSDRELPSLKAIVSEVLQELDETFPGTTEDYDVLVSEILQELEDLDSLVGHENGFRAIVLAAIAAWFAENPPGRELSFREMAWEILEKRHRSPTEKTA